MKTGNIGIRNLADIDVYGTKEKDYYIIEKEGLDYICVNDAYQHKKGTTYYNLDNKGIILDNNCVPYAFVGTRSKKNFLGCLAIILNTETGQLFYPKTSTDGRERNGYVGQNAYNVFCVEFEGYKYSNNKGVRVYANEDGEYFVNGKSTVKSKMCRECEGLPIKKAKNPPDTDVFTINKKTFRLPDDISVTALNTNPITKKMTLLVDNDRREGRKDKEDQTVHSNLVPSDEDAENIFKKVATLWNNYENLLYVNYLTPDSVPGSDIPFILELTKLDDKKLLMPELINNGVLPNVSETFLQDFFRNKIKGNANLPIGSYNFYQNDETKQKYELAGQELVQRFYEKNDEDYYKTKIIADAIYKTETGKSRINDMIKLIDQVFQHWFTKGPEELGKNTFLKSTLDNKWFEKGIDLETFPSFEFSSLNPTHPDEEKLALFCIGGTQAAKVAVKNFTPIVSKTNVGKVGYNATIYLQYLDTFGVSESDYTKDLGVGNLTNITEYNYRGGVMAQWVLQHQYGYKPFADYLTYEIKMKSMWEK